MILPLLPRNVAVRRQPLCPVLPTRKATLFYRSATTSFQYLPCHSFLGAKVIKYLRNESADFGYRYNSYICIRNRFNLIYGRNTIIRYDRGRDRPARFDEKNLGSADIRPEGRRHRRDRRTDYRIQHPERVHDRKNGPRRNQRDQRRGDGGFGSSGRFRPEFRKRQQCGRDQPDAVSRRRQQHPFYGGSESDSRTGKENAGNDVALRLRRHPIIFALVEVPVGRTGKNHRMDFFCGKRRRSKRHKSLRAHPTAKRSAEKTE